MFWAALAKARKQEARNIISYSYPSLHPLSDSNVILVFLENQRVSQINHF